ncbi:SDR family oxidoreductase [Sphingomonas sp. Leaf28]|uniref:SDR family oxidoreductase n=1 Tax=Sphingomonas sp. Leaf28 TaxID=1735695 RepID=UPI000A6DCDC3|nr:SDR family oxidoreductase [Sphingomonas sp. Leaf28]
MAKRKGATMHVLVIGAGGFVGRHLVGRLVAEGVRVTAAGRDPARLAQAVCGVSTIRCDLTQDVADDWLPRLCGVDAVVNCAGLIRDGGRYATVHDKGARALFDACLAGGVGRVVQVSALGADAGAATRYHLSKRTADDHLAGLDPAGTRMDWVVLRPSLIIGRGGQSSALFGALAALPLTPRLGQGRWRVQPIHVDDLVAGILRLLHRETPIAARIDVVGPEPMTTDALTASMRRWLGLAPAPVVRLPRWMLATVIRLGIGPVTHESLTMLEADNTGEAEALIAATGLVPATLDVALARTPATDADRLAVRLMPLAPVLRWLLALVWLAGGIVPLALTPAGTNFALLARAGLNGTAAITALVAGAVLDLAIGLALLARLRRAALAGIGVMLGYTAVIAATMPALWADPFGALVKNAAILGLALAVHVLETDRG